MPREEASAGPSPRGGGTGGSRRPEAEGSAGMLVGPWDTQPVVGGRRGRAPVRQGPAVREAPCQRGAESGAASWSEEMPQMKWLQG